MSDRKVPIVYADIGDGKERRFFLGADELRQVKRECGRGFYTIYMHFSEDADADEVRAILRLALIGGGASPDEATSLTGYYCSPPRPLKAVFLLAYKCLDAAWAGTEASTSDKAPPTEGEINEFFTRIEATLLRNGMDLSVMRNRSFGELQAIMQILEKGPGGPDAPDKETFNAIKEMAKGM